jgi:uncharacterized membrane protein
MPSEGSVLVYPYVNETVPREQWAYWDLGFLTWGAAMVAGGWLLLRAGEQKTAAEPRLPAPRR